MKKQKHLTVSNSDEAIEVASEFWRVRHERGGGGCVADIRISYGTDTNLLAYESAAVLDRWSEAYERHPVIRIKRLADGVEVRVTGHLCDAGGLPGPVSYRHTYHYTLWSIRHTFTLSARYPVRSRQFCPTTLCFASPATHYVWGTSDFAKAKPRYMHIIGPHYDDIMGEVPNRSGVLQEDASAPVECRLHPPRA